MNNHIGDANKMVAAAAVYEVSYVSPMNFGGFCAQIITPTKIEPGTKLYPAPRVAAANNDPSDPWRGLYAPELMPQLDGAGDYHAAHPDLPDWLDEEERSIAPLIFAQGFTFHVICDEYPDEGDAPGEEFDTCAWLANWKPEPPEGEHWRLAMIHDTEDGPAAVYVRPLALIDTKPKIDTFDLVAHLQRQREWSELTFGPGTRAAGIVDHIRKELLEIEADPGDLREWIDVAILALDGAWRSGASPQQIIDALVAKQTKNEGRVWPDWRTMHADKAIEHDRSADSPNGGSDGRYFSADPALGEFTTHDTLQAAIDSAESMLSDAGDDALESGWTDDPPQICYGVVLGDCVEVEGSRKPAPEGSEFAEHVEFKLQATSAEVGA